MSWKNCRLVSGWESHIGGGESGIVQSNPTVGLTNGISLIGRTNTRKPHSEGMGEHSKRKNWEVGGERERERESRIRMTGKVQTFVQRAVTDGEKAIATTACACVRPELLPGCCACVLCRAPCRLQRQFLGLLHTHTNTHAHAQNPLLQQRYNFLKPSLPAKQAKEELWSEEWLERGKKKKKNKFGYVCVCVCWREREESRRAWNEMCL